MLPRPTIQAFDQYLASRGLQFHGVVIGGSALNLMGVVARQTRDFDILVPELPSDIAAAARAFAVEQRSGGVPLADDWLNNGPTQLSEILPEDWRARLVPLFAGEALTFTTLGRADLLKTKLFALCDRGTDLTDCIALAPSAEELEAARPWVELQDANPGWPEHVRNTFADLSRRLSHGV